MSLIRTTDELIGKALAEQGYAMARGLLTSTCVRRSGAAAAALIDVAESAAGGDAPSAVCRGPGGTILQTSTDRGMVIKIERISVANAHFGRLADELATLLTRSLGEPYCLFKDKINLRPPGDDGFGFHQDFESYRHHTPKYHVTAMISLVPTTPANGCLFMARGYRDRFCPDDVHTQVGEHCLLSFVDAGAERGNLLPSLAARFRWLPVATARADVLLFDSFVPHGSKGNRSAGPRPALFLTFVPGSGYAAYHNYYFERFGYRAESDRQPSPAGSA